MREVQDLQASAAMRTMRAIHASHCHQESHTRSIPTRPLQPYLHWPLAPLSTGESTRPLATRGRQQGHRTRPLAQSTDSHAALLRLQTTSPLWLATGGRKGRWWSAWARPGLESLVRPLSLHEPEFVSWLRSRLRTAASFIRVGVVETRANNTYFVNGVERP